MGRVSGMSSTRSTCSRQPGIQQKQTLEGLGAGGPTPKSRESSLAGTPQPGLAVFFSGSFKESLHHELLRVIQLRGNMPRSRPYHHAETLWQDIMSAQPGFIIQSRHMSVPWSYPIHLVGSCLSGRTSWQQLWIKVGSDEPQSYHDRPNRRKGLHNVYECSSNICTSRLHCTRLSTVNHRPLVRLCKQHCSMA